MAMLAGGVFAEEARAPAKFQDKLPQPTATLDASGRVLPLSQGRAAVDVIGGPSPEPACASSAELPAGEAEVLVRRIAGEEQFDASFAVAVAKAESRLISTALSEKGAYGLMQLTPETAERFKVDRCEPAGNVRGGLRFLRHLQSRHGNPFYVLAAYNAGEKTLIEHRGVPPFAETVRFVAAVMNDLHGWPGVEGAVSRSRIGADANAQPSTTPPIQGRPTPAKRPALAADFVMHVE
ncbi:MAG: lytic transglycosylase domain-containing protein [Beijerinckiaceae bacterium]|nr:lytic transglycosylase domain-containing protein [Beijerinckiaceae bacterium]